MKLRFITFLVASVLVGSTTLRLHTARAAAPAAKESAPKPVGKQTAAQLIADAQKALAFTVKSARAGGKELDPTNASAKPFYQALKKTGIALDEAKAGLEAKDKKFFQAIFDAKAGVSEMSATWDLTRSKNADVISGAKKLAGAVTALEDGYGPLAARKAKGGELTDKEKEKFAKMKAQQVILEKRVRHLASKVKGDPALEAGLKEVLQKSRRLAKAPETVNAFTEIGGLVAAIQGLLTGYSYYVNPSERGDWVKLSKVYESFPHYSTYEWSTYDWSITSNPVEVYDDLTTSISESEVSTEDSFVDSSSFELSEAEENEVAEESDQISEDEAENDEMESEQEEAENDDEAEEMNDEGDDSGDDMSDDGGSDDAGDDGGGDDTGGDDGGGDE